jgi:hypothetical protein
MIAATEAGALHEAAGAIAAVVVNFLIHATALWGFRATCLANADRYLGRARPTPTAPEADFVYAMSDPPEAQSERSR